MNDIIISAKIEEANLTTLKRVLEVAQVNGLLINVNKSKFLLREVTFIGHVLFNGHVQL